MIEVEVKLEGSQLSNFRPSRMQIIFMIIRPLYPLNGIKLGIYFQESTLSPPKKNAA